MYKNENEKKWNENEKATIHMYEGVRLTAKLKGSD